jgi:phage shock protein PspC (stress-responsive transcriptional regulator)
MTEPDQPTGPTQDLRESHPPAPRRLTRSTTDQVLGGVAGGLGRYFDVDPILFRIAFVVLTFVGGAGALAYLGAWLLVPTDVSPPHPTGGRRRAATIAGAVVLVCAALPFLDGGLLLGGALVPVAIVALLVAVLARGARGDDDLVRVLARVALAVLVVGAGLATVFGVGIAAAFGGGVVIAILLVVAGVALLVGAFVGGARWLIVPALLIAVPLGIVAASDLQVDGGVGERAFRPASAAELRPGYELGVGQLVVDLRDVKLPPGQTDVKLDLGMGEALVFVPDDVCVASDVRIGAGYAQVLGRESEGLDVDWQESPRPGSAPGLRIDADLGVGSLEIVRSESFVRGGARNGDRFFGPDGSRRDAGDAQAACAEA